MPELLAAWVLFPAVLILIATGCGMLIERLSGTRLSGALIMPLGLATVFVVARLLTSSESTAPGALPAVLLLGCSWSSGLRSS